MLNDRSARLEQLSELLKETSTSNENLTICITGATSGIGLYAAKLLFRMNPLHRLILVGRTKESVGVARAEVLDNDGGDIDEQFHENVIALACDHCSLSSIPVFSQELRNRLEKTYTIKKWARNGLDVLCLNAAVLTAKDSKPSFTEDHLEVTFQTNYLAPFLIGQEIQDVINPGGRVVFATSGLHVNQHVSFDGMVDPVSGSAKTGFAMIDNSEFHFKQSYALSKVCNVAYCMELCHKLESRGIQVNCFSPGLMTTSGLFRNQGHLGNPSAIVPKKSILKMEKPVDWGAGALVYMVIADATGRRSCEFWRDSDSMLQGEAVYGKHFQPVPLTDDTLCSDNRRLLWRLSCELIEKSVSKVPERIRQQLDKNKRRHYLN